MGWVSSLKNKLSGTKTRGFRVKGPPDTKFLGDFLVYQFLDDHFGLKDEQFQQFSSELPDELKELTKLWALFYLSWLFKLSAAEKYGSEFSDQPVAKATERLEKVESLQDDLEGIGGAVDFWFSRLDECTLLAGTEVSGIEVPFEVFAATAFLMLDEDSPHYKSTGTKGMEFDVGIALAAAKDAALPLIQNSISIGGPIEKIDS